MVEYGNLPYYTLAAEDIDTNEAGTYVSQYGVYYNDIVETYNRYAQDFAGIIDQQMLSHTINGDLVTVEYANGTKVLINYSGDTLTVDGYTVLSMDYVITNLKGGYRLRRSMKLLSNKENRVGYLFIIPWIIGFALFFLYPLWLLAGAGVFFYKKRRHI